MTFEQAMAEFLNKTAGPNDRFLARDIYPESVTQERFENCLRNMFLTAPDPHSVRTKAASKVRRVKQKRYTNKAVLAGLKKQGKSAEIGYVLPQSVAPAQVFALVDAEVPKGVTAHVRRDLVHDIVVDILSGDLPPKDVHKQIRKYIRAAYKFLPHSLEDYMARKKNAAFSPDQWKAEFVPTEFEDRPFDERIDDLKDKWGAA